MRQRIWIRRRMWMVGDVRATRRLGRLRRVAGLLSGYDSCDQKRCCKQDGNFCFH
jgi:hypothetical protein